MVILNSGLLLQDMFILLDLIGARNPEFKNWFSSTSDMFDRLKAIGKLSQQQGISVVVVLSYRKLFFFLTRKTCVVHTLHPAVLSQLFVMTNCLFL